jgi:hypothetical protein
MMMEELQTIETPVSDLSAGIATGIGIGLAIVGLALCC